MATILRITLLFVAVCFLAYQGVSAQKCNNVCTFEYNPVCGSDYVTYATQCVLEAEQCEQASTLSQLYKGECECETMPRCTKEYDPHCGSDGKVYGNKCMFNAARHCDAELKLVNQGECKSETFQEKDVKENPDCHEMCTADYSPVCGSNLKTYSNLCALEVHRCKSGQKSLISQYDGECECDETPVCPEFYAPICGSDEKTYDNQCVFDNAKLCNPELMVKKTGSCKPNVGFYNSGAGMCDRDCPGV